MYHTPHDAVDGNYNTLSTYPMDGRIIQHPSTTTMRLGHYDDSSMSVGNNKKQKVLTNLLQHNNRNRITGCQIIKYRMSVKYRLNV